MHLSICDQKNIFRVSFYIILGKSIVHWSINFCASHISFEFLNIFNCDLNWVVTFFNTLLEHFFITRTETNNVKIWIIWQHFNQLLQHISSHHDSVSIHWPASIDNKNIFSSDFIIIKLKFINIDVFVIILIIFIIQKKGWR